VAITYGDEIIAVFRKANSLHLAGDFVGCHFNVIPPVPDIDDHVMLRADRYNVFIAGRESLRSKNKYAFQVIYLFDGYNINLKLFRFFMQLKDYLFNNLILKKSRSSQIFDKFHFIRFWVRGPCWVQQINFLNKNLYF